MSEVPQKRRLLHSALRELVRFYAQLQAEGSERRKAGARRRSLAGLKKRLAVLERRMSSAERALKILLGED